MSKNYNEKALEALHLNLIELSDIEIQKRRWLGIAFELGDGLISSSDELYHGLYDYGDLHGFLTHGADKFGFSDELILAMINLDSKLQNYDFPETDTEVINDPKWHEISAHALNICNQWKNENILLIT